MTATEITRAAKHGTQRLYLVDYTDEHDTLGRPVRIGRHGPAPSLVLDPRGTTRVWAYNMEHAIERFAESSAEAGWIAIRIAREHESTHKRIWHWIER